MSSAPTDCRVPDPTDAKADGNFGNHRAGYGDRLDRIIATARKGWTLAAGEGLVLVQEIDRLRQENETLHSRVLSGSLEDRSAIHQLQDLNLRHQEVNDRLRRILTALREPSEAVVKAVKDAIYEELGIDYWDGKTRRILYYAVAAAEQEVGA